DLRRWMLFDNATGKNTQLGIPELNGTRRTGYRIIVKDSESKYLGSADTLLGGEAPIIDRDATTYPEGVETYEEYVDYLYDNYFVVQERDDMDRTDLSPQWSFKWYPEYYYFGLHEDIMSVSPYLEQTKGWDGLNIAETFDPIK